MVGATALIYALAAVQAVIATPVRSRTAYQVKERHFAPRKWQKLARAPSDHVIDLRIGVRQSNFDELERRLYEGLSCPSLESLNHHQLTQEQSPTLTTATMASI